MFSENRYVESCTFFMDVNKSVYKRVTLCESDLLEVNSPC